MTAIRAMLLDVGGVLLTNGWDSKQRRTAAEKFNIEFEEMEDRHHLTVDAYELGKLSLDDYLRQVVFHRERAFSAQEFKAYMFSLSQPFQDMINLIRDMKSRYHLRTCVISNEGRELMLNRIRRFNLSDFIDEFICSSFVQLRKGDEAIYRMSLDIIQTPPEQCVYIEDRPLFVEVARKLGIHGITRSSVDQTERALGKLGLQRWLGEWAA